MTVETANHLCVCVCVCVGGGGGGGPPGGGMSTKGFFHSLYEG